jgi:putative ubiquitin-RnfH superfamily antitoxin RatB of RatAB toxin-antitoxin module
MAQRAEGTAPVVATTIEVACALPDRQRVVRIALPAAGLTAGEAVALSGLLQEFPEIASRPVTLGIYGVVCDASRVLRPGDRVEIYRPLRNDPRAARRARAGRPAARPKPR